MAVDFLTCCRSRLVMVGCPWVVQMPDIQLETCLFEPGPLHNRALMWALSKIDPNLQDSLNIIREEDRPKGIVRLFTCIGLVKSTESDKILGNAPRKELESFWDSVLNQICLLQEFEASEGGELNCDDTLQFVSALTSNSDFWDLLEKKPDLLPADTLVPALTATLEDLKIQLADMEERFADAESQSLNSESNITSELAVRLLSGGSILRNPEMKRIEENLIEEVAEQIRTINDNYQKFMQQLVTVIKKSPQNLVAKQVAKTVLDLNSSVQKFIEFLENLDEIKRLETAISSRTLPEDCRTVKDSLHEFISSMNQQTALINNLISTNKDALGL